MQSLVQKLTENNISFREEKVSRTYLFGKSPEKMIHLAYVSKDSVPCRMYQLVFTGDRVLDMEMIKKSLNEEELYVQRVIDSSRSEIQLPFDEQLSSDFITVFDESVLLKDVVHVATSSPTDGFWVNPKDLKSVFDKSDALPLSLLVDKKGFELDIDGEGFEREMDRVRKHMNRQISTGNLPLLFDSTRKEIESIESEDIEFLEDLINSDPFMYGHFLFLYYKSRGEKSAPSPKDIIFHLGEPTSRQMLKEIAVPGNNVSPVDVGFTIGESIYRNVQAITFLLTDVLESSFEKLGIDPKVGKLIGRFIGYNTARWMCVGESHETHNLSNQIKLNKHRNLPDIQRKFRGFDQLSLCMHTMKEIEFPEIISMSIANHWNPLYQGEYSELANLLYIIRAKLEEDALLDMHMFSPVSRLHNMLAQKLNIEEEVISAFKRLEGELEFTGVMSWRFRVI